MARGRRRPAFGAEREGLPGIRGGAALDVESHVIGNLRDARTAAYHTRPFGRPIIECFLGGDGASMLVEGGPAAGFAHVLDELAALFGSDVRTFLQPLAASTSFFANELTHRRKDVLPPCCTLTHLPILLDKRRHVPILFSQLGSTAMADSAEPTEAEVEAVIEEFGGDLRAAIRGLLHDVAVLASDFAGAVSHGIVRGRVLKGSQRAAGDKKVRT